MRRRRAVKRSYVRSGAPPQSDERRGEGAYAVVGESARMSFSLLSSAQRSAGTGWRKAARFRSTCVREIAPGMIEARIEDLVRFRFRGDFWLTSGWVSREIVRAIKVR